MAQKKLPLINSAHGSETRNIINELIKLFNGMGYTYNEALSMAKNVLREAKLTNDKNVDTNNRLNKIISEVTTDTEIIDARGNHPVLKNRLDDVKENFTLDGWELQNKRREVKPLVTFIDDDGRSEVLTKLKPLSEKYNIPFTVTVYVRAVEDESMTQYMNKEDLQHLQNDMGWEISSHTYTHPNLGDLTDEEQEYELKHSKEVLESWGLKVSTLCYPYDGRNQKTYDLTRKYYRSGRRTGGRVNTVPLETYEMRSTTLGSWFEQGGAGNTFEHYKSRVDEAIETNGWVIFMTHVADPDHDATQQEHLEETIKYIQQNNVDIVTYDEGLNRMGNIVDIGNYGPADRSRKHFVVGADGTVQATEVQDTVRKTSVNEIISSTKPSELEHGHIYTTRINTGEAQNGGYPIETGGNLTTVTSETFDAGLVYTYQEYRPIGSNDIYIRYATSGDDWNEWELTNTLTIRSGGNAYSSTSNPSDYPDRKVTYTQIFGTNTEGFPNGEAGILITSKIASNSDTYNFQEYYTTGSTDKFIRFGKGDDSWGEWQSLSPASIYLPDNYATDTDLVASFPSNKISYCRITGSNPGSFPGGNGVLATYNNNSTFSGFNWQEYDVFNSWGKYKRYAKTDGTWSDWREFQMI